MHYLFMNKNNILLRFHTEEEFGTTSIIADEDEDHIRIPGYRDITDWVERRNYAKHKDSLKKWLHEWGLDTVDGFLDITHGLGLNDTLWVKRADSTLVWEEVNLYHNEFSDIVEKTAFETGLYGLHLKSTSPEFTSEGSFPKCWKKEGNGIFLYKQGSPIKAANTGLEPYSEYYGSRISAQLNEKSISYDLVMFKDHLCTRCGMFTTEQVGFVPMYRYLETSTAKNTTLPGILKYMEERGYGTDFRMMLLIDSICLNQDRHLGNFGFLVDNDSYEILGIAPLFDYNQSFFCNALEQDLADIPRYINTYQVGHKLGGEFWEVAKAVVTKEIKETLPSRIEIPVHNRYNLESERFAVISDYIQKNYQREILGKRDFYSS